MKRNIIATAGALLLLPAMASAQSARSRGARYVKAPTLASPPGYSHAVVVEHGKLVYLAGQVALNAEGELVGARDFRAQVTQAFENLRTVLAAVGATPAQIVKLNYYVVGLTGDKLAVLREVRDGFIDKSHPPASTLVGVQALFRDGFLVEIEGIAVLP